MELNLPIDPIPCPRPRIVVRKGFGTAYYPAAYKKWKEEAAGLIRLRLPPKFNTIARRNELDRRRNNRVTVTAVFNVRRPKSTSLDYPKPDIDNYLKALLDACTSAGVWEDDCVVVRTLALKSWAVSGSIDVTIRLES